MYLRNLKQSSLPKQGGLGWVAFIQEGSGGEAYTLMTPLTPSETGCKACVYRGFDTLAPLKWKFSRTRAHKVMNLKPETWNLKPEMRQRGTVCKVEFSKMFARTSFLNTLTEIRG